MEGNTTEIPSTNGGSDLMLTPAQLAAALSTSERTIARMVRDGCPSLLVGSRRRFDLNTVKEWCADRTPNTQPCPSEKMPKAAGTPKSASAVNAYTAAYRKAQLRVMPSDSKPN